jgi:putative phosphoesterase
MKLFIASDIHGSESATEMLINAFIDSGASQLILLGDVLNHGPRNPIPKNYHPANVAQRLNQYADKIIAVRGNCDSEVDQMLLDFPMMSDLAWVLLENGRRLALTHGHIYHAEQRPPMMRSDVLIHGHTHVPVAEHSGDCYLFNPGSVTFPRQDFSPSYGVLNGEQLSVLSFDQEIIMSVDLAQH